jgi:hypothetical protein
MTAQQKAPDRGNDQGPSALSGGTPSRGRSAKVAEANPLSSPLKLPAGMFMTQDHRYYFNGKGPYPSVTTVLSIMDKPAVMIWKARESARAMWSALNPRTGRLPALSVEEGTDAEELKRTEEALINWAVKEADKARDTAAKLGSSIHLLADMASRATEKATEAFDVGEEAQPYLAAFRGFLGRYSASSIVSSEKSVLSENGYAGTYDLIMRIDGELWLVDIKTSKGYYPEYGLQLSAYRWADSIILPDDPRPYPMPQIDRTGVLHLRPDQYPDTGWRLVEYPTDYTRDYMPFLGALELYQWKEAKRFTKSNLGVVNGP